MQGIRRFTTEEACEYLGCSKNSLYRFISAGYLSRGIRLGRRSFWFEDQLNGLIERLKKESKKGLRK